MAFCGRLVAHHCCSLCWYHGGGAKLVSLAKESRGSGDELWFCQLLPWLDVDWTPCCQLFWLSTTVMLVTSWLAEPTMNMLPLVVTLPVHVVGIALPFQALWHHFKLFTLICNTQCVCEDRLWSFQQYPLTDCPWHNARGHVPSLLHRRTPTFLPGPAARLNMQVLSCQVLDICCEISSTSQ